MLRKVKEQKKNKDLSTEKERKVLGIEEDLEIERCENFK